MAQDRRATLQAILPPFWGNSPAFNDSTNFTKEFYAIRSAVAGTLKVTLADDSTATMQFTAGETRPVHGKRIWSTGTVTIVAGDVEVAYQD